MMIFQHGGTMARILGDYMIMKQLGEGALGTAYLAEHRFLKKLFVLKVLPETLTKNKEVMGRFEKEVPLLSKLEHPHLLKIHTVTEAQGLYFIVSDYIEENESLLTFKGSREDIVELMQPVAEALDYLHEQGVVHGTLKPGNILLQSKEGGAYHPYLTDYGLLSIVGSDHLLMKEYRMAAESGREGAALKQEFTTSWPYLAPEQKGLGCEEGQNVDSYAFGVLTYFLLTGHYPEGQIEIEERHHAFAPLLLSSLQQKGSKRPERLSGFFETKKKIAAPLAQAVAAVGGPVKEPSTVLNYLAELSLDEAESTKSVAVQIEERIKSDLVVTPYKIEVGENRNNEPVLTPLSSILEGEYVRGSMHGNRDEMPRHKVMLPAFAIEIHPVTNEQFVRFLDHLGEEKDEYNHDVIRLKDSRIKRQAGKLLIEPGYFDHPVVGVTWYGASLYAKWIGRRLPSEAEWEAAALGGLFGDAGIFPTGAEISREEANFFSSDTTAVMSYAPNGYNLFDVAGNVYEWCQDWYDYHYYALSHQEPNDPKGPVQGVYRVLRGGCWKSLKNDLRVSHRHRNNPGTANSTYGFRCAITL